MDKTFNATKGLIDLLGEEWAGTYTIRQLNSTEFIHIADELIDDMRKQGRDVFTVPAWYRTERMVYKSVLHNGEPVPFGTLPAKLFELLVLDVVSLNSLSPQEKQELFLVPTEIKVKTAKI